MLIFVFSELHTQLVALSNGEITADQIKAPSIDESHHSQELVKNTKRKIEYGFVDFQQLR